MKFLAIGLSLSALSFAGLAYAANAMPGDRQACLAALGQPRVFAFSARSSARFDQVRYAPGDALLFGPETRGLPAHVIDAIPEAQRRRLFDLARVLSEAA